MKLENHTTQEPFSIKLQVSVYFGPSFDDGDSNKIKTAKQC